jgi:hypothetical protein
VGHQFSLFQTERPHQALDNATPAERYHASPRRFDGILRAPEYNNQDVRKVCASRKSSGTASSSTSTKPWPASQLV